MYKIFPQFKFAVNRYTYIVSQPYDTSQYPDRKSFVYFYRKSNVFCIILSVLYHFVSICAKTCLSVNYSLAAERTGERVAFLQKSSAKKLPNESFLIVLCVAVHSSAEHRRVCWADGWEL